MPTVPYKYKNQVQIISTTAPAVSNQEGAFIVKNKADPLLMKKKMRPFLTDITVNYYGEERQNPIRVHYPLHKDHLGTSTANVSQMLNANNRATFNVFLTGFGSFPGMPQNPT